MDQAVLGSVDEKGVYALALHQQHWEDKLEEAKTSTGALLRVSGSS